MPYGTDTRVGINFQAAYGTGATTSMHWLEPLNDSVNLAKEQIVHQGLRGIYDEGKSQEGRNTVGGGVTIEAKPVPLGALLTAVMNETATVTSGSVYTHTFKPRTSDFSTACAEKPFTYAKFMGDTGSMHLYADCAGSALSLEIANGELLRASLDVVGGTFSQTAAIAASYTVQDALDWSVSSVSINASAKTNVRNLSVRIDNKLEAKHAMGTTNRYPSRVKRTGFRTIEISGTLLFDDQTEFQQFIAQSEQRMFVHLRGQTAIQSGYYDSLTIDAPAMRFTDVPQSIGGPGEMEVSFRASAKYHTGSANALTVTLVNCKSGY